MENEKRTIACKQNKCQVGLTNQPFRPRRPFFKCVDFIGIPYSLGNYWLGLDSF